jgi:hypothetical protein
MSCTLAKRSTNSMYPDVLVWLRVADRLESFQMHIRWAGSDAGSEKGNDTESEREMLLKLLPIAFLFMALVLGASTVRCALCAPAHTCTQAHTLLVHVCVREDVKQSMRLCVLERMCCCNAWVDRAANNLVRTTWEAGTSCLFLRIVASLSRFASHVPPVHTGALSRRQAH